jgi:hypothetical protein
MSSGPWFGIATSSSMGRRIFKYFLDHPEGMQRWLLLAQRCGIINPATLRFINHQLDTEAKRWRIYRTWTALRLLRFDLSAIQRVVESEHIRVAVYLASQDQLVAVAPVRAFLKRLKSAHLEVIDSNHRRVLNEALARIAML